MIGAKSELRDTVLGRPCHIVVDDSDGQGEELVSTGFAELQRLTAKFSSSHPDSIISKLNNSAGSTEFVALDAESRSLFQYVTAVWEQSRHMFDPSSRILSDCYHGKSSADGIDKLLSNRLGLVGWAKLEIGEEGARLP